MTRLAEVADINPRPAARASSDALVSFLRMADIDAATGTTSLGIERPYGDVSKGYTPFESGDLLVAKITPCFENGKIAQATIAHRQGAGSTEFHVIRPHPERLDPRYALHVLRAPAVRRAGERRMVGSAGQRRVPEAFLAGLALPLPPIKKQRWIADILDRADALRVKRREALTLLDDLSQAIFLDMFGDVMSNDRGWPRATVGEFVAGFESGRNIVADDMNDTRSPFRVLKVSAVTSLRFRAGESKPVPPGYQPPGSHLVRDGDVLFSRANTTDLIGATALVTNPPPGLLLPDKLWRFKWHEIRRVEPLYVLHLFRQPRFRREVGRRATGTSSSMRNISQPKVLSIATGLPPLSLQERFAEGVRATHRATAHAESQAADLLALFESLQQQAFRGEL